MMETCPGDQLDRGPEESDIHTCRFEPVRANTTAVTNGLAIIVGRRLKHSAAG